MTTLRQAIESTERCILVFVSEKGFAVNKRDGDAWQTLEWTNKPEKEWELVYDSLVAELMPTPT